MLKEDKKTVSKEKNRELDNDFNFVVTIIVINGQCLSFVDSFDAGDNSLALIDELLKIIDSVRVPAEFVDGPSVAQTTMTRLWLELHETLAGEHKLCWQKLREHHFAPVVALVDEEHRGSFGLLVQRLDATASPLDIVARVLFTVRRTAHHHMLTDAQLIRLRCPRFSCCCCCCSSAKFVQSGQKGCKL